MGDVAPWSLGGDLTVSLQPQGAGVPGVGSGEGGHRAQGGRRAAESEEQCECGRHRRGWMGQGSTSRAEKGSAVWHPPRTQRRAKVVFLHPIVLWGSRIWGVRLLTPEFHQRPRADRLWISLRHSLKRGVIPGVGTVCQWPGLSHVVAISGDPGPRRRGCRSWAGGMPAVPVWPWPHPPAPFSQSRVCWLARLLPAEAAASQGRPWPWPPCARLRQSWPEGSALTIWWQEPLPSEVTGWPSLLPLARDVFIEKAPSLHPVPCYPPLAVAPRPCVQAPWSWAKERAFCPVAGPLWARVASGKVSGPCPV